MSSDFEKDPWNRFKALPENEQQIIEAIKGIEVKQQDLQYEYQRELFQLNKKYATLFDPLYDRRKELVAGVTEPDITELEAGEQALQKVFGEEFQAPPRRALHSNGVSNFWLAVFMNHPGLSMVIAPEDQKALEHLTDIRCIYFGGEPAAPVESGIVSYADVAAGDYAVSTTSAASPSGTGLSDEKFGFKLSFYFSDNEYFWNDVLEKTYYYKQGQVNESGELLYETAVGCSIFWKSDMDLTKKDEENEPSTSFFTFFDPKTLPSKDELEKMEDEAYGALLDDIDGDFDCGEDIRDEIIPYALTYLIDPPVLDDDDDEEEEEEAGDDS